MHGPGYASDTYTDVALTKKCTFCTDEHISSSYEIYTIGRQMASEHRQKNIYKRMKYHKTRRRGGGGHALDIIGTFRVRV